MAPGRSEVALDFELNTHVSQLNFAGEYLFLTCEDINPREKNQNGTQENPENPQNGPQENPEKPSRRRKGKSPAKVIIALRSSLRQTILFFPQILGSASTPGADRG